MNSSTAKHARKTAFVIALLAALALPALAGSWPGDDEGRSTSYLGVDTRDVTSDRMATLKLKQERGAEITMVDQDAPAGKIGLKEGDVILSFNGQPVESVDELRRMIHETPAGRNVTLGISRDGKPMTFHVQLADRRKVMSHFDFQSPRIEIPPIPPIPPMPPMPAMPAMPAFDIQVQSGTRSGLLLENLTPQLAEFFGAQNGEGVLVRSVEKGSAAEAAGFKAGDVIVRVDKEHINDLTDWRMVMRGRTGKVPVGILRDRKEQTVTLAIGPRERGAVYVDLPDLNQQMEALGRQMELLEPQIERTVADAMNVASAKLTESQAQLNKKMQQATILAQHEMKRQQKAMQKAQKQMEKDAKRAQKDADRARRRAEKQAEKDSEE